MLVSRELINFFIWWVTSKIIFFFRYYECKHDTYGGYDSCHKGSYKSYGKSYGSYGNDHSYGKKDHYGSHDHYDHHDSYDHEYKKNDYHHDEPKYEHHEKEYEHEHGYKPEDYGKHH